MHVNFDPTWQTRFDEAYSDGEEPIQIDSGYRLLFASGAIRDTYIAGHGKGPPENPRERLRLQVKFHTVKLNRAIKAFDDYKRIAEADVNGWSRQDEILAQLKALKAIVKDREKKLDQCEDELDLLEHGTQEQREHHQQIEQATNRRQMDYQQKLKNIEV